MKMKTPRNRKVVHVPPKPAGTLSCYFCSKSIAADERIRRFHDLSVHETCWQREANR
jgi:hypothetical protein